MTENPFRQLWTLGYRHLVPIIPPGAPISERSSIARRLKAGDDARGKTPGVRWPDGTWSGFDWLPHEADERDLERWHAMGAGVGVKTGRDGVILIDADTLDEDRARTIRDAVTAHFGPLHVRIGRYPKAGYLLRVPADANVPYQRVEFGERDDSGRLRDRVEILSTGRQFVAIGVHATTGAPYRWPTGLPAIDDVPTVDPGALTAFLNALRPLLPAASEIVREGASTVVNQEALRGDPDMVERAVRATPNTSDRFPTREAYRDFGYAIKAAIPDDEPRALALFQDWAARWQEGDNDPAIVEADWRRMKPPFRRGAGWLYEIAEDAAPDRFSRAEVWFQPIPESTGLFENQSGPFNGPANEPAPPEPIRWVDPKAWEGLTPPAREWEVEGWIPKGEVTLLYGDGGVGKTLVAHQYATAAAAGRPWLGQPTRTARVMCFFCEDSEDELMRRQIDINAALGVSFDDLGGRLRIASRKYMDNLFILWDRHTGAMKRQAVWQQLHDDAIAFGADVIIVDTIADTYGGSEIDRGQVNAFVKSCLGRLAAAIGGSVIALGHPSMSGKASGSGTSGSTAWSNAARSRLFLRYPKGVERGNVRELEGMKSNYGPKGNLLKLRWARGAFDVIAGTTAPARIDPGPLSRPPPGTGGDEAGAGSAGYVTLDDAAEAAVLAAVSDCVGARMSAARNSPHWAPRVLMRRGSDLVGTYTVDEVDAALGRLERKGAISFGEVGRDERRHAISGYRVAPGVAVYVTENDGGVFD